MPPLLFVMAVFALLDDLNGLTCSMSKVKFHSDISLCPADTLTFLCLGVECQYVVHPLLRHEAGGFLPRAEWGRTKL